MYRLTQASALCYRIYDVGEEINLERAKALVVNTDASRLRLSREGSEYIQLANPPLAYELGVRPLKLKSGVRDAHVTVRLFDHGALSVVLRVEIPSGTPLEELVPFSDDVSDNPELEKVAHEVMTTVRQAIAPAIKDPHLWEERESYTVFRVREIEDKPTAKQLLEAPSLPRLILGEARETTLSEAERRDVLSHAFSYTEHDLAVIDWNCAFLYEPPHFASNDVADLLEIANAQLLEFRYYDDVLDKELTRVYDAIEKNKGAGTLVRSPYKQLLRELMLTLIEMSEFIERVDNSLVIVADVYLGRVYEAAVGQLRIPQWQVQVSRKQKLLSQTYALLKGEVDTGRALTLEMMVVLLILLEIIVAFSGLVPH
ncbi:MAG: hypothetical protein H6Q89_1811 [Myxococcaceae bacterium]|nr:hypothetical protein [Myxococcaceae bacterium]